MAFANVNIDVDSFEVWIIKTNQGLQRLNEVAPSAGAVTANTFIGSRTWFKAGQTHTFSGNVTFANTTSINLGDVGNISVGNGTSGQVLARDANGSLQFVTLSTSLLTGAIANNQFGAKFGPTMGFFKVAANTYFNGNTVANGQFSVHGLPGSDKLRLVVNGNGARVFTQTGNVVIGAAGSDVITINSATKHVGIGTTTPTSQLHLKGASTLSALTFETTSASNNFIRSFGAIFEIGVGSTSTSFQISAAGTSKFFIDQSGNTGFGTNNPKGLVELSKSSDPRFTIRNSNEAINQTGTIDILSGSGTASSSNQLARIRSTITQATPSSLKSRLSFATNQGDSLVDAVTISDEGDVGIGTTPISDVRLYIQDSGAAIFRISNSINALQLGANSTAVVAKSITNVPLIFGTNNIDRLFITTGGNIGLNTTPSFNNISLGQEIQTASAAPGLRVERTGTGAGVAEFFVGTGGAVTLLSTGATNLVLGSNNVAHMTMLASGNTSFTGQVTVPSAVVSGTITATTFGTSSQNAFGARTISTSSPSGGTNGDIWYKV